MNELMISETRLAQIWSELNTFKKPMELRRDLEESERNGAMALIEALIGKEACLAWWNNPKRKK